MITTPNNDTADAASSIAAGEIITTCCTANVLTCNGTVILVIHLCLDYRVTLVLLNARPSRRRVLFEQGDIKGSEAIVVVGLGIGVVVLWFHRRRSLQRGLSYLGRNMSRRCTRSSGGRIHCNIYPFPSFSDDQAVTATISISTLPALLIFHCRWLSSPWLSLALTLSMREAASEVKTRHGTATRPVRKFVIS